MVYEKLNLRPRAIHKLLLRFCSELGVTGVVTTITVEVGRRPQPLRAHAGCNAAISAGGVIVCAADVAEVPAYAPVVAVSAAVVALATLLATRLGPEGRIVPIVAEIVVVFIVAAAGSARQLPGCVGVINSLSRGGLIGVVIEYSVCHDGFANCDAETEWYAKLKMEKERTKKASSCCGSSLALSAILAQ